MDFTSLVKLLVPDPCFDEYFTKYNFLHTECFKVVLSKCLGYAIIIFSMLVKMPQIVKIWNARSGEGVSMLSITLELFAITAGAVYGYASKFPFSAYGEGLFLGIQTILIAFLVLNFGSSSFAAFAYTAVYTILTGVLLMPFVPFTVLAAMQASIIPVVITSKMLQAWANYKAGSTGQLSAVTVGLLVLGSIARIFTSVQETGDAQIVLIYCLTTFCNSVIFAQILYYGGRKAEAPRRPKTKKAE